MAGNTTGVNHASVTTTAWLTENAAKIMNPNALQGTRVKAAVEKPLKEAACAAVMLIV